MLRDLLKNLNRLIKKIVYSWLLFDEDDIRLAVILRGGSGKGWLTMVAGRLKLGHVPEVRYDPIIPYFGTFLRSRQGDDKRHFYMQKTLEFACATKQRQSQLKVIEIGSWAGSSAITLGNYIQSKLNGRGVLLCVDPWEIYLNETDNMKLSAPYMDMTRATENNKIFNLFLHNIKIAGLSNIVIPIKGNTLAVLPLLKDGIDYAFIDGSHYYENVIQDIRLLQPLIKVGGVLAGDDLELQSHQLHGLDMSLFENHDCVQDTITGTLFHPGVTRAVGEVFGEVSSWEGHWAMKKSAASWEKVEIEFSEHEVKIPAHLKFSNDYPR